MKFAPLAHGLHSPNLRSSRSGDAHAFVAEIPVAERPSEIVERFQSALVGGGMPIWKILYHDSKFEDH
jgi:hypothetical protein